MTERRVIDYGGNDSVVLPAWNPWALASFGSSLLGCLILPAIAALYLAGHAIWIDPRFRLRGTGLAMAGGLLSLLFLGLWWSTLADRQFPSLYDPAAPAAGAAGRFYDALTRPDFNAFAATTAGIPDAELHEIHAGAQNWGTMMEYGFGDYRKRDAGTGRPAWNLDGGPTYSEIGGVVIQVVGEKQTDGEWRVVAAWAEMDDGPDYQIARP